MIGAAAIGVLTFCSLYSTLLAVAYRARCRQLERQVRRMGGVPEDDCSPR